MDKRLTQVLADVFGVPTQHIVPELKKSDVGSWDSLKQMDLVLSLEREYALTLEITDIIRLLSIGDIITVLKEKGVSLEA